MGGYAGGLATLRASWAAIPPGERIRLAKRTSNLFRARERSGVPGLDVSGLREVFAVDVEARTAEVGGMCTYEDLVDATLPHGLAPLVVPQLKTITLGGAVTGLGIESTSFRDGLPHESVLEMDILTGTGEVITCRPQGEHADLFHGFANSYGSLGYATRLLIELAPVARAVALRHVRFDDLESLASTLERIVETQAHEGEEVHYLDGVVFSATESYLVLGRQTDEPGPTSDYTGMNIYYRSIQHDGSTTQHDLLTIKDYLWRWDTDWFWCSRAFGAQNPRIRRWWPKRLLRSSFYWKLVALDHRHAIGDRIEALHGRPPRERVVQDVEIPARRTVEFLRWFLDHVPIEPIWLCPLRLRNTSSPHPWPLYPLSAGETYVNVGFWSSVAISPGQAPDAVNRQIEQVVADLGGHKSLYSDSFYDRATFDRLYGGAALRDLKDRYDPDRRLLDLHDKAVRRQ